MPAESRLFIKGDFKKLGEKRVGEVYHVIAAINKGTLTFHQDGYYTI
ncbi:MAG: hypothetical protein WBB27_08940 [Maribacter sp.]